MDPLVIAAIVWLGAAALVGWYAQHRGADGVFFGFVALVLSPLVTGIYVAAMDPAKHRRS
jgi:hypothetical protein